MSIENQQSALPDSVVEFSLSKDLDSEKEKLKDKNANLASIVPSKPNHVFDISSLVFFSVYFWEVIHGLDKLLRIFIENLFCLSDFKGYFL